MTNYDRPITWQNIARLEKRLCPECGEPLVLAIDSITGEISDYLYTFACDCYPGEIMVSIG